MVVWDWILGGLIGRPSLIISEVVVKWVSTVYTAAGI